MMMSILRIVALITFVVIATSTQSQEITVRKNDIDRTNDGHPNMQGIWHFGSATPFQRPLSLGHKQFYSKSEAFAMEGFALNEAEKRTVAINPDRGAPEIGGTINNRAEDDFESARIGLTKINGEYRTSLIVGPANGRLPYRDDGKDIFDQMLADGIGAYDGPESRPPSERCVNGVGQMAPMIGWKYNANMSIIQTPKFFVIDGEMHSPRIIPFSKSYRRHGLTQWMGESVGSWEGDTFIVETKNFRPESSFSRLKSSGQLHVIEKFIMKGKNEIFYQYSVTDPKIYTQSITVEMSINRRKKGEYLYEWACHEGNYSMQGILSGARKMEAESFQE